MSTFRFLEKTHMEENVNETKVEKGITLVDLWIILTKYWIQMVVLALVATIIVSVLSYVFVKRKYTASAKLIINANSVSEVQNISYANANKNYGISLYPSIKDMLMTTNTVSLSVKSMERSDYEDFCAEFGGSAFEYDKRLGGTISCTHADEESLIFMISFTTTQSEDVAIGTVNAIAYGLIQVADTEKKDFDPDKAKSEMDKYIYPFGGMLKPVQLATNASSAKNWKIYPILAFVGVLALLYVYFLLLYIFDDTVKSKGEVEDITGFNVIAFIEDMSDVKKRRRSRSKTSTTKS